MTDVTDNLRQGYASGAELAITLMISQPTLSRRLAETPGLLKMGKGRATRYALLRPVASHSGFALYRIDPQGNAAREGTLYPVWPGESCVVESSDGQWSLFDGIPWYLSDMRPQGFLGRLRGRDVSVALGLPADIRDWTETHTLIALSQTGDETVGNAVLGEVSYQRWFTKPALQPVAWADKLTVYQHFAERSLEGEQIGSSAGGEQPKFSIYVEHQERAPSHVLVKFSATQSNENSRRWADLLRAEAHALNVLNAQGVDAACATIIAHGDEGLFLQVERFDRVGMWGRRGVVSLEAVAAEFTGAASTWQQAAKNLFAGRLITLATLERIGELYAFGKLIANSDMHQGNLSFIDPSVDPRKTPLQLSPVYDMLPMAFAPGSSGNMRRTPAPLNLDTDISKAQWQKAQGWAVLFWQNVTSDDAVSEAFRRLASQMLAQVEGLTADIQRLA